MSNWREEHAVSRLKCFGPIIDRSKQGSMDSNQVDVRTKKMMGIE